eukprot:756078-Pelagomonas_calceolata.AAC.3
MDAMRAAQPTNFVAVAAAAAAAACCHGLRLLVYRLPGQHMSCQVSCLERAGCAFVVACETGPSCQASCLDPSWIRAGVGAHKGPCSGRAV